MAVVGSTPWTTNSVAAGDGHIYKIITIVISSSHKQDAGEPGQGNQIWFIAQ
jgi:hypothetical protein